jgi:hypothetical protein
MPGQQELFTFTEWGSPKDFPQAEPQEVMKPDANGLFTLRQVAVLAAYTSRDCATRRIDAYALEVSYGKSAVKVMATDEWLWNPAKLFRACREAAGKPHYEIDYARAKIRNPGGLDERRIAEIVGAAGAKPYLTQPSQYYANEQITKIRLPPSREMQGHVRDGAFRNDGNGFLRLPAGERTFAMMCLLHFDGKRHAARASYDYRLAAEALDDAGLIELSRGPRGGLAKATFAWTALAFLPARPPKLDAEDRAALDGMAL